MKQDKEHRRKRTKSGEEPQKSNQVEIFQVDNQHAYKNHDVCLTLYGLQEAEVLIRCTFLSSQMKEIYSHGGAWVA